MRDGGIEFENNFRERWWKWCFIPAGWFWAMICVFAGKNIVEANVEARRDVCVLMLSNVRAHKLSWNGSLRRSHTHRHRHRQWCTQTAFATMTKPSRPLGTTLKCSPMGPCLCQSACGCISVREHGNSVQITQIEMRFGGTPAPTKPL